MTTFYVGLTAGVWAAGTPGQFLPGADGRATLAEALDDAADGDVIQLAPGEHELPASLDVSVRIVGHAAETVTLTTATPVSVVPEGVSLRLELLTLAGGLPLRVNGTLACYRCATAADSLAEVSPGGAGVAVWCGKPISAMAGAAVGNHPQPARTTPGGEAGGRIGGYRHRVELQAAAKRQKASGQQAAEEWLTFADLRVTFDERPGRQGIQERLIVANATGLAYCRGGVPVHPTMRLLHNGRALGIQGVALSKPPRNELEILYAERVA